MAYPVYSTPLLTTAGASPLLQYDVPAGYVVVVRDISGVILLSLEESIYFNASLDGQSTASFFQVSTSFSLADPFHWEGRVVIPQGGFVSAAGTNIIGSAQFQVSGYVLPSS